MGRSHVACLLIMFTQGRLAIEHLCKYRELIAENGREQEVLIRWFKGLVMIMRQELKNKIIPCPGIVSQCPPNIAGLFLMAERAASFKDKISRDVEDCLKKDYMAHVRDIRWTAEADLHVEKNLWTLFVDQMIIDGFAIDDHATELSACFNALVNRRSSALCLLLWLFRKFVTQVQMGIVESIAADESLATWCLQDRMLFWLACISDTKCSKEKTRNIEAQISGLQLENGDLISSAIGLLVLISCAKKNNGEGPIMDALQKTVRWIIERIPVTHDAIGSDFCWAYYALCEYVNLFRRT